MKITILGQEYEIVYTNEEHDERLKDADGYCDPTVHKIVIDDCEVVANDVMAKQDLNAYKQQVLRHEAIHAFLHESGLSVNSDWATNEEMVDWIAIQMPKIVNSLNNMKE